MGMRWRPILLNELLRDSHVMRLTLKVTSKGVDLTHLSLGSSFSRMSCQLIPINPYIYKCPADICMFWLK